MSQRENLRTVMTDSAAVDAYSHCLRNDFITPIGSDQYLYGVPIAPLNLSKKR